MILLGSRAVWRGGGGALAVHRIVRVVVVVVVVVVIGSSRRRRARRRGQREDVSFVEGRRAAAGEGGEGVEGCEEEVGAEAVVGVDLGLGLRLGGGGGGHWEVGILEREGKGGEIIALWGGNILQRAGEKQICSFCRLRLHVYRTISPYLA